MTRIRLAASACLAICALAAPAGALAKGNSETSYTFKLSGTQVTSWSYDHTNVDPLGCSTHYSGKGEERYDFDSPRSPAVLRTYRKQAGFEVGNPRIDFVRRISGASHYENSGPEPCAQSVFKTDADGCGVHRGKGNYQLSWKGRSRVQLMLSDDYFHMTCPSAASGGYSEAGGHGIEMMSFGEVNLRALQRSRSKRIQGRTVVKKPIKHGNTVIGEEATTITWTLHAQRKGRTSRY